MDITLNEELEDSFLPVYTMIRSILYSDYGRKNVRYTKTQIAVLAALYWQNEMCMSQVAGLISTPRAQMTRAVVPLVNDGLVERFTNSSNRKHVHVRLTDAGREFVKEYLHTHFDSVRKRLKEDEAAKLAQAAQTIVEVLKKLRVEE